MKEVYASVGSGGLQWMLLCHPDLLFVTKLLICPGLPVLVDEDSDQKSSQELPSTERAASLGVALCERLLMRSMWGGYSSLTPSP